MDELWNSTVSTFGDPLLVLAIVCFLVCSWIVRCRINDCSSAILRFELGFGPRFLKVVNKANGRRAGTEVLKAVSHSDLMTGVLILICLIPPLASQAPGIPEGMKDEFRGYALIASSLALYFASGSVSRQILADLTDGSIAESKLQASRSSDKNGIDELEALHDPQKRSELFLGYHHRIALAAMGGQLRELRTKARRYNSEHGLEHAIEYIVRNYHKQPLRVERGWTREGAKREIRTLLSAWTRHVLGEEGAWVTEDAPKMLRLICNGSFRLTRGGDMGVSMRTGVPFLGEIADGVDQAGEEEKDCRRNYVRSSSSDGVRKAVICDNTRRVKMSGKWYHGLCSALRIEDDLIGGVRCWVPDKKWREYERFLRRATTVAEDYAKEGANHGQNSIDSHSGTIIYARPERRFQRGWFRKGYRVVLTYGNASGGPS